MYILNTRLLIITVLIYFFTSCNEENKKIKTIHPGDVTYDRFTTYILDKKNLSDTNYEKTYIVKCEEYIARNEWDSAAEILNCVGVTIREAHYMPFCEKNAAYTFAFFKKYYTKISNSYKIILPAHLKFIPCHSLDLIPYLRANENIEVNDYKGCYGKCKANFSLIEYYRDRGLLDSALYYGNIGKELSLRMEPHESRSLCFEDIHTVYVSMNDYFMAKKILIEAKSMAIEDKDTMMIYKCLLDELYLLDRTSDTINTVLLTELNERVYDLYESWGDPYKVVVKHYALVSKFNALIYQNKLDDAKIVKEEIEEYAKNDSFNDLKFVLKEVCLNYKFKSEKKIDLTEDNLNYFNSLKENKRYCILLDFYRSISQNTEKIGDFKTALKYNKLVHAIKDSISNINTKSKVKNLEVVYKVKEKNSEIALHKQTIHKNKILVFALILVIFGLIVSFIAYMLNKQKKELQQQKELQNNYTMNLLQNTETERKRIASDLHDSVNQELVSLRNDSKSNTLEVNQKLDDLIAHVRIISRNLHPVLFESIGLKDSIIDLLERVQTQHKDVVFNYDIKYNNSLPSTDEIQIYRIIQESINNTLKHAKAQAMMIKIEDTNLGLLVEIRDSGKGFDVEKKLKDKNSFGLLNIANRIKAIGGVVEFTSNEKGTNIKINIFKKINL